VTRHQALAAEVYSYLPVRDVGTARTLAAQIQVVQVLLRLRPSRSQRLHEAVDATWKELALIERALEA
jgi:hypothetical protein